MRTRQTCTQWMPLTEIRFRDVRILTHVLQENITRLFRWIRLFVSTASMLIRPDET